MTLRKFWRNILKMREPLIYACRADLPDDEALINKLLSAVRSEKRAGILNQKNREHANEMLVGEMLMLYALKDSFSISPKNVEIALGEHGKPYLKNFDKAYFNISHSGGAAVCAVYDGEVGVDIQKISKFNPSLAKKMCSAKELEQLGKSERRDYEFSRLWSVKEAYHKLCGTGILYPDFAKEYDCRFKSFELFGCVVTAAWR